MTKQEEEVDVVTKGGGCSHSLAASRIPKGRAKVRRRGKQKSRAAPFARMRKVLSGVVLISRVCRQLSWLLSSDLNSDSDSLSELIKWIQDRWS